MSGHELKLTCEEGEAWYQQLRELEQDHLGKWMIIAVDTGEYVIGDDQDEASRKAGERFSDQSLYIRPVGEMPRISGI